jgi:hypothetical protein
VSSLQLTDLDRVRSLGGYNNVISGLPFIMGSLGAIVVALSGGLQLLGVSLNQHLLFAEPDLLIFVGLVGFGGLVGARYGGQKDCSLGLFLGCAAALVATANLYFLAVADYSILMDHDSPGYLHPGSCRTPGYWAFLSFFKTVDARWLIAVQLNLVLASQVTVSWAVRRVTNSTIAGIATLLIATLFAQLYSLSFWVLTEAVFSAALGFAAAASIAYIRSPSNGLAVAVGLSVGAAIAVKAVAPPLVVANALVLLRPANRRGLKTLGAIGIPILCLSVLMVFARISHGSWSPTNIGGYALAENVAWGIKSDQLSSDPALSAAIESRLEPFTRTWPSPQNVSAYLERSMEDLDPMFWGIVLPIVYDRYKPPLTLGCPNELDSALSRLAIEAIRRNPGHYASHVGVQYLGLWGFALVPQIWRDHALEKRLSLAGNIGRERRLDWQAAPAAWKLKSDRLRTIETGANIYEKDPLFLDQVKSFGVRLLTVRNDIGFATANRFPLVFKRAPQYLARGFGLLTLAIASLCLWMRRLQPEVAALALLALLINAYFLAHALFMFASPRYAACAEIPLAALISILCFVTINKIAYPAMRYLVGSSIGKAEGKDRAM